MSQMAPETPLPLVLLPGMNCSAQLWSGLDLGPVLNPRLTEPSLTGQVDRLLDELPAQFDLVGLSLGGIVAMALIRTAPERVTSLYLLSTNPYGPTEQQLAGWQRERRRLAAGTTAREIQSELLPVLLGVDTLETRPDVVATALAMADDVGEVALDAQLRLQQSRIDERPALRDVSCPTLVVAAGNDRLCSVERHTELASLVPGGRLHVLERAAHLSPLERPIALRRVLALRTR
jgi:pimeloyl-ACP methyl ester carboxylesterase